MTVNIQLNKRRRRKHSMKKNSKMKKLSKCRLPDEGSTACAISSSAPFLPLEVQMVWLRSVAQRYFAIEHDTTLGISEHLFSEEEQVLLEKALLRTSPEVQFTREGAREAAVLGWAAELRLAAALLHAVLIGLVTIRHGDHGQLEFSATDPEVIIAALEKQRSKQIGYSFPDMPVEPDDPDVPF